MRRFFILLVTAATAISFFDTAIAQDIARKTRYVYIWDLTGSIKRVNGLSDKMFDYLQNDVKLKTKGTEISIIPFNDNVLRDELKYRIDNDDIKAIGNTQISFDGLREYGQKNIKSHHGFTDIAKPVFEAEDRYITGDYNTIFILLTDGGQEYYTDSLYVNANKKNKNVEDEEKMKKAAERLEVTEKVFIFQLAMYYNYKSRIRQVYIIGFGEFFFQFHITSNSV